MFKAIDCFDFSNKTVACRLLFIAYNCKCLDDAHVYPSYPG